MKNILQGDSRDVLKTFPDNHFHAIVTDPPYELTNGKTTDKKKSGGFMGKAWDGSGVAFDVSLWQECLRVLKPGGYLLSFGGSRTYHRMACAIEDAGFILHPMIGWVQGQGFPKASNLSKQIDARGGKTVGWFGPWLRKWRTEKGITQKEIAALFPSKTGGLTGCVANWELGLNLPTNEQFNLICKTFEFPFESMEEAEREVIGQYEKAESWQYKGNNVYCSGDKDKVEIDITAPATPEANAWDGWYYGRQSLKPALDPICMAQKPPEGRMVDNIRAWGCGGVNIDGCRIGIDPISDSSQLRTMNRSQKQEANGWGMNQNKGDIPQVVRPEGRFPANLILGHSAGCKRIGRKKIKPLEGHRPNPVNVQSDGNIQFNQKEPGFQKISYTDSTGHEEIDDWLCEDGCPVKLMGEQSGICKTGNITPYKFNIKSGLNFSSGCEYHTGSHKGDTGTAARFFLNIDPDPFFYCAKASASERRGCKHPTIKPKKLISYLIKLICPPGGIVLDPFLGSGTTGMACNDLGFDWVGIDLDTSYAKERISHFVNNENEISNVMRKSNVTKLDDWRNDLT